MRLSMLIQIFLLNMSFTFVHGHNRGVGVPHPIPPDVSKLGYFVFVVSNIFQYKSEQDISSDLKEILRNLSEKLSQPPN